MNHYHHYIINCQWFQINYINNYSTNSGKFDFCYTRVIFMVFNLNILANINLYWQIVKWMLDVKMLSTFMKHVQIAKLFLVIDF